MRQPTDSNGTFSCSFLSCGFLLTKQAYQIFHFSPYFWIKELILAYKGTQCKIKHLFMDLSLKSLFNGAQFLKKSLK